MYVYILSVPVISVLTLMALLLFQKKLRTQINQADFLFGATIIGFLTLHSAANLDIFTRYFVLFCYIAIGFGVAVRIEFKKFATALVRVGEVLAAVSLAIWLPLFLLPNLFGPILGLFALPLTLGEIDYQFLGISNFPSGLLHQGAVRNLGIYSEPGLYAAVLSVLLGLKYLLNQLPYKHYGILIVALLSTQSTAGYIVVALFSLLHYSSRHAKQLLRLKITKGMLVSSLLLVGLTAAILASGVITSKFDQNHHSFLSALLRANDTLVDLLIWKDHFLLGAGFARIDPIIYMKTTGSSNALTSLFASFGLIGGILFLMAPIRAAIRNARYRVFIAILAITLTSQNLLFTPLLLALLFYMRRITLPDYETWQQSIPSQTSGNAA